MSISDVMIHIEQALSAAELLGAVKTSGYAAQLVGV